MSVLIALSSAGDLSIPRRHLGHQLHAGLRCSILWRARSRGETAPSAGAQIRSSVRRSVNPVFDDSLTYSGVVVVFSTFDYRTAEYLSL